MHPQAHLDRFVAQFKRFRALAYRHPPRNCDQKDYEQAKLRLKDSMRELSPDLNKCDLPSLLTILFHCMEMSSRCSSYQFNSKLVQLLISRFQSRGSPALRAQGAHDKSYPPAPDEPPAAPELPPFGSRHVHERVSAALRDEVYLIHLLSAILRLRVHPLLSEHFEFLFISLNRSMAGYSEEHLVELCRTLGDLYLQTRLDGLRTLLHRALHALMERLDRRERRLPIYDWIQLVKSINKCNENYLYKKTAPYILASVQSSPHLPALFEPRGFRGLSDEQREELYKFVKLANHLLTNMLLTGMTDCLHLLELITRVITRFLVNFASRSLPHLELPGLDGGSESEYDSESELTDAMFYRRCSTKLYRTPASLAAHPLRQNSAEECALYSAFLRLLHTNKLNFVRSVKLNEMYLRTVYPSLHARLDGSLLRAARLLAVQNDREYVRMHNLLAENAELVRSKAPAHKRPLIVLVDVYYIIALDCERKLFLEVLDQFNRERLRKNVEFKLSYLGSQGWKCIKVFK